MASTRTGMVIIVGAALLASGGVLANAARLRAGVFAAPAAAAGATGGGPPIAQPLGDRVPPGVTLVIGDPMTEQVLKYTGWDKALPFKVRWARITGGPAVTEAFHARALDVGAAANMPPIHSAWVGLPAKMIAVKFRQDAEAHPVWRLAVAPGSNIRSLADLKGKRIAFSPGQVQGEVVLRSLEAAHLTQQDVKLVELPSPNPDLYLNALVGGMIDAAPIAPGPAAEHYVDHYGAKGAALIDHGPMRDDLSDLFVLTDTLKDPAKAAALKVYIRYWAMAVAWIGAHPDEWAKIYYEQNQGLSPQDAAYAVEMSGRPVVPSDWSEAIALEQGSVDLMARETRKPRFDAASLFDRRFEPVAAQAFAATQAFVAAQPPVQLARK
jgi:sulfonate transport system substrate-binding protein